MWGAAYRKAASGLTQSAVRPPRQGGYWITAVNTSFDDRRRGLSSSSDDGGRGQGGRGRGRGRNGFSGRGGPGGRGGQGGRDGPGGRGGGRGFGLPWEMRDGGGGRGPPGGRGRGPPGGRGRGPPGDGRREPNFNERFIDPAKRGELKNHRTGIPKLIGRPPKGHGVRGDLPDVDNMEKEIAKEQDEFQDQIDISLLPPVPPEYDEAMGMRSGDQLPEVIDPAELARRQREIDEFNAKMSAEEYEPYYWKEADYTEILTPQEKKLRELMASDAASIDDEGNTVITIDDDELFEELSILAEGEKEGTDERKDKTKRSEGRRDDFQDDAPNLPFPNVFDALAGNVPYKELPPDFERVTPLKRTNNSASTGLIKDMMAHETRYMVIDGESPHPESHREPKPIPRKFKAFPPSSFVENYTRFLFVTGLPPVMSDGNLADFENDLIRLEIQKTISDLFSVQSSSVFPVDLTSAFIGFATPPDQRRAMINGPSKKVIESPVIISKFDATEDGRDFAKEAPERIVRLQGLPTGLTKSLLASLLFPKGSEIADIFGTLSIDNVAMPTANSALVRLQSEEMADSAMTSALLQERLVELGQHRICFARARRNLKETGRYLSYKNPEKVLGDRLIIDGDMPTRKFFLSHSSVIHIRGLDPLVSKEDIAKFFQPFCYAPRDVSGSVEFVKYENGIPSGKAYIGFDELGECERFYEKFTNGLIHPGLLGEGHVIAKKVREKKKIAMERRPTREIDELLDDLKNWEKHADPEELQKILDYGISKEALDDTFRVYRYKNHSFAALDQAIKEESMEPELERGESFRKLVREYISMLSQSLSTPENPGFIAESLFLKDEPIDLSIFDGDKERVEKIKERRKGPQI